MFPPPQMSNKTGWPVLTAKQRLTRGLAVVLLLCLFGLASGLQPETQGYGTHQQLGLGPCPIRQHWNVACPSCGMTTAWAYAASGDWRTACRTHFGGTMLGVIAVASAVWLGWTALLGKCIPAEKRFTQPVALLLLLGIVLVDWCLKLAGS